MKNLLRSLSFAFWEQQNQLELCGDMSFGGEGKAYGESLGEASPCWGGDGSKLMREQNGQK